MIAVLSEVFRQLDKSCIQAFGRDLIYVSEGGISTSVRGILENTAEPEDASPGVYSAIFVLLSDLQSSPERGDQVEIDGVRYRVFDIDSDLHGAARLRLRRVI